MIQRNKALGALGLARRAGKLSLGRAATEKALRKGRVRVLVLASDLSPGTREKLERLAEERGVPVLVLDYKEELGPPVGRQAIGVLGILDPFFARLLQGASKEHRGV